MPVQVLRILCCAMAGFACGFPTRVWIRQLQQQRGLTYSLTPRSEWLLNAAMAAAGGAAGAMTDGVVVPVCALFLLCICGTVFVIDWTYRIIPNQTVLAVFGLKLLMGLAALAGMPGARPFEILQSLIGFAACFLLFAFPGLMGKKVGAGDVKLAAAMGFLLGVTDALMAVVIMGMLILGYCMVQNKMPILAMLKTNIPMGPFIAVGMFAAFLYPLYPV